jgi:hypothetical protein
MLSSHLKLLQCPHYVSLLPKMLTQKGKTAVEVSIQKVKAQAKRVYAHQPHLTSVRSTNLRKKLKVRLKSETSIVS